jgi:NADH-quinone oxidoreductase subunit L
VDEHACLNHYFAIDWLCFAGLLPRPLVGKSVRHRGGLSRPGGAGDGVCRRRLLRNGKQAVSVPLWTWMSVGDFNIGFNLVLDGLSLTMLSVVTGVGFLIHMFASWYMRGEEGYSRFFAYTNLFIASMVVLVLADNLLLMYLGWEGVGLCSYLLIGFYYTDPKNGAAAMKAFVVTRVGDVFLAFALFILYNELGTLNFREMVELAPRTLKPATTCCGGQR